jgi:hypothetical protein
MKELNKQTLRNTRGGSVWISALLIAFDAYWSQRKSKSDDWGGGESGGAGAGGTW